MTKEEFCNKFVQEGVELKRNGYYNDAFGKYLQAIDTYPDNPQMNTIFYAMGKLLYLAGNGKQSVAAYQCHAHLSYVPSMGRDYHNAFRHKADAYEKGRMLSDEIIRLIDNVCLADIDRSSNDSTTAAQSLENLASFFFNPALHFGHAYLDLVEPSLAEKFSTRQPIIDAYKASLMGRPISLDTFSYQHSKYNFVCIYMGSVLICSFLDNRMNLWPEQYNELMSNAFALAMRRL